MVRFIRFWVLFLGSLHSVPLSAQTDTEFWFVAPEVTSGHNDSPVVLRISAFSTATNVQISMPANPGFNAIQVNIPANSSQTVDLTSFKETLENKPANAVLNKGLFVKASAPVTAYYEVAAGNNPDIFPLKGNNAKGREFYTPFQDFYDNGGYFPPAFSGFDIVATEDNTTINILPSRNIAGHAAGQVFSITLNRGQTWSGLATSTSAAQHPAGTHITSDKPICVTIKDDSMVNGGCRDLMGDQMVPVELTGTDYIVMKGFLGSPDRAFVLATEDNTEVYVDGSASPAGTINRAEQLMVTITNPTAFIRATRPVYVLHITGFGCEMGGSLLPTIRCTGSTTVYFTRSTNEFFGLNVMVKAGSEGSFLLNGSNSLVPASLFQPVNGTNGEWVSAQIQFNPQDVPVNVTSVLTNTSANNALFHLGIINGGASSGCRYGYFSDFNAGVNFGGNKTVCLGDSLELNAGTDKDSYLWSTGDTIPSIMVKEEGIYWVLTSKAGCIYTDTVSVLEQEVKINLGKDTSFCGNETLQLSPGEGFQSYLWQDGSSSESFTAGNSGTYSVEVITFEGCKGRDSVSLSFFEPPVPPSISGNSPVCAGDTLRLQLDSPGGGFTFSGPAGFNGQTGENRIVPAAAINEGEYLAYRVENGCRSDTVRYLVSVNDLPQVNISGDSLVCAGDSVTLDGGAGFTSYAWSQGGQQRTIVAGAGTYQVTVSNAAGCKNSDQMLIAEKDIEALYSLSPPSKLVPLNSKVVFSDSSSFPDDFPPVLHFWDFGDGNQANGSEASHQYALPGTYTVTYITENALGCADTISFEITVFEQIIIPNAFSPNGDLQNDFFVIQYLEIYPNPTLIIYNRWGRKVYSSDNYQNNWDGGGLPDGTYFYILEIPVPQKKFTGTVYLSGND
jgi:gliding motility-associated-like protein